MRNKSSINNTVNLLFLMIEIYASRLLFLFARIYTVPDTTTNRAPTKNPATTSLNQCAPRYTRETAPSTTKVIQNAETKNFVVMLKTLEVTAIIKSDPKKTV